MPEKSTPQGPPTGGSTGSGNDNDSAPAAEPGGKTSGLFRGRALLAAAAVGIGVVAAVVIVSLTTDTEDGDPGDAEVIAADDGESVADEGSAPTTEATTVDLGAAASVGDFSVTLRTDPEGIVRIDVDDPETPSLSDLPSQHCVLVDLAGAAAVEAYGCADPTASADTPLTLSDPAAAKVGCAAVATNEPPAEVGAAPGASTFLVAESAELPAGSYQLTVTAVSGVGDGCEPADGPTERVASTTADLELG